MLQSGSDTIEGVVGVAVFLGVIFVASRIVVRFNAARFDRAFAPIVGTSTRSTPA